jgi:tetratricopeptide (TPR) repeat protein
VGSAGSGYIFTAALHDPDTGSPLASFRRTAAGPDEVIAAIDGLSQDIREKAGESLRTIKAEEPLDAVTTSSLQALRKYSEAETLGETGEYARAKTLLEEAVALDPDFAMAWRKLAVTIQSTGGEPGEEQYAATRAYELRDRLTELERANAVAYYHNVVTGDPAAQMEAYENLLRRYPDDPPALNNLAIAYSERTRNEEALELLARAVGGPGESAPAHVNKVVTHAYLADMESAWAALAVMEARYPQRDTWNRWDRWFLTALDRDWSAAHDIGDEMSRLPQIPPTWRHIGHWMMAMSDAAQGKLAEAEGHLQDANERARADERHEDVILASDLVVALLTDEESLAARVRARLRSPSWQAVPAVARPYGDYVRMLTSAGELDLASELLDEWEAEVGESASFAQNEARLVLDARVLGRDDPAAGADALERFQQEGNCPRCMRRLLAELSARAGRLDRAAELYEDALVYTERWSTTALERPLAHERLGALYEELGNDARAADHYARFAELWADADPDLQPRVRHARQRADALAGAG